MKVLAFGNPLAHKDSIALRMLPSLRRLFPEIEFAEADPAESLEAHGRDLLILDAAEGIASVELLEGVAALESPRPYSLHDFDLSLTLKLLMKAGKLDSVRIIAVPHSHPLRKAVAEAAPIISSLSSGSGWRSSCRGRRRG